MNVINIVQTERVIDTKAFRRALGNFATGMMIMTAQAEGGFKPNDHRSYRYSAKDCANGKVLWTCPEKQCPLRLNRWRMRCKYRCKTHSN